jgi:hypothetical protein
MDTGVGVGAVDGRDEEVREGLGGRVVEDRVGGAGGDEVEQGEVQNGRKYLSE